MTILYYDCFSGISGDMNLGAMVDLGIDKSYLTRELKKLNINGYMLSFETDQRKGITGTRADVSLLKQGVSTFKNLQPATDKSVVKHDIQHVILESQEHGRSYTEIAGIIQNSDLSDNVKKISLEIFRKLGFAEAHIHGKTIDEIHFHEVGAVDAIVDIVGAAICFDYLKPDRVICSPVQLGGGTVNCAHGIFPVPAPATLEIMKNKPVRLGAVPVETTTPTGAAIITTLADEFSDQAALHISKIGYGIGHRDNAIPNVLRVCLCEQNEETSEKAMMLECNIDDMNPEIYGYIMDKLFESGAEDVFFQTIMMKKNRPAIKLSVLCNVEHEKILTDLILIETSTLGMRKYAVEKIMLQRRFTSVDTKWGPVRVKHGYLDDILIKSKPEYDDCLKLSLENKIPLSTVYQEILRTINKHHHA